jgi:hypothetical protein
MSRAITSYSQLGVSQDAAQTARAQGYELLRASALEQVRPLAKRLVQQAPQRG